MERTSLVRPNDIISAVMGAAGAPLNHGAISDAHISGSLVSTAARSQMF
jgi:hypothetical protein